MLGWQRRRLIDDEGSTTACLAWNLGPAREEATRVAEVQAGQVFQRTSRRLELRRTGVFPRRLGRRRAISTWPGYLLEGDLPRSRFWEAPAQLGEVEGGPSWFSDHHFMKAFEHFFQRFGIERGGRRGDSVSIPKELLIPGAG